MLKIQEFQELTGTEYVMADAACKHDKAYEKKSWKERIQRFHEMDLTNPKTFKEAYNPIGLRAAVLTLEKKQERTGYMISLDAASSGLQLLSLLISCPKSWKLCGGDENILDAYTAIYDAMGIQEKLDRKEVKQSIMTALYGSVATPKNTFGKDIDVFYETMENIAPGAWELNEGIQDLWGTIEGDTYSWVLPDNFYACIETQETVVKKFHFLDKEYEVNQKIQERPRFHKGLGPNLVHSIDGMIVREMYRRCQYKDSTLVRVDEAIKHGNGTNGKSAKMVSELWGHYVFSGFLSARILDYLYEDTIGLVDKDVINKMISSMPLKPFELVCVHDCFRCHPNYGNDLRRQYNYILADINDSQLMSYIAQQVSDEHITTVKAGRIPREVIESANYTLS